MVQKILYVEIHRGLLRLTRSPKPRHLSPQIRLMCTMATRHEFTTIGIVGIVAGDHGRNCDEHSVCGNVLSESEDVVVRLQKVQVLVDGKEETAIAVYWITGGTERCRVGFLQRHMVEHAAHHPDADPYHADMSWGGIGMSDAKY